MYALFKKNKTKNQTAVTDMEEAAYAAWERLLVSFMFVAATVLGNRSHIQSPGAPRSDVRAAGGASLLGEDMRRLSSGPSCQSSGRAHAICPPRPLWLLQPPVRAWRSGCHGWGVVSRLPGVQHSPAIAHSTPGAVVCGQWRGKAPQEGKEGSTVTSHPSCSRRRPEVA